MHDKKQDILESEMRKILDKIGKTYGCDYHLFDNPNWCVTWSSDNEDRKPIEQCQAEAQALKNKYRIIWNY